MNETDFRVAYEGCALSPGQCHSICALLSSKRAGDVHGQEGNQREAEARNGRRGKEREGDEERGNERKRKGMCARVSTVEYLCPPSACKYRRFGRSCFG
eukprot:5884353-Pleurochrysis_carterae.AAC.2